MNDKEDYWGIAACVIVVLAVWFGLIAVCANLISGLA